MEKIRGVEERRKKMGILDVSTLSVSGRRGEGEGPPLSLIKLNRNLISMGNVSTNWLGKDLCEWGIARCPMMHDLWVGD